MKEERARNLETKTAHPPRPWPPEDGHPPLLLSDSRALPPALSPQATPAEAQSGGPRVGGVCGWCSLAGSKGHSGGIRACLLSSRPFWNRAWVRCSQPRAKPSHSWFPPPTVTHSNQMEARQDARPRRGSSPHSTTKSQTAFLTKCGQRGTPRAPLGVPVRSVGCACWALGLDARCRLPLFSRPLGASGPLRRWAGQMGGWAQGRSRASRRGRGTSVWAGVPGVGPGPGGRLAPWLRLRRWVVTGDRGGGGQVGTWQHSQGRAGLGAPCGLRTRLGHQDGFLPDFQDVC